MWKDLKVGIILHGSWDTRGFNREPIIKNTCIYIYLQWFYQTLLHVSPINKNERKKIQDIWGSKILNIAFISAIKLCYLQLNKNREKIQGVWEFQILNIAFKSASNLVIFNSIRMKKKKIKILYTSCYSRQHYFVIYWRHTGSQRLIFASKPYTDPCYYYNHTAMADLRWKIFATTRQIFSLANKSWSTVFEDPRY